MVQTKTHLPPLHGDLESATPYIRRLHMARYRNAYSSSSIESISISEADVLIPVDPLLLSTSDCENIICRIIIMADVKYPEAKKISCTFFIHSSVVRPRMKLSNQSFFNIDKTRDLYACDEVTIPGNNLFSCIGIN